ncbi:MAG: PspC domain-containing protein [candidate division KSB1 bacterium]|nr:PspC domain-containing protein [candidate division KSB1 bacterium]MDZ7335193.1 PspC domain-containing protein [candidate division KSB1 bacterium]MDZ7356520.1 PspC domain-containing protein [candidate division KSB1 bacterium]MDZ7400735.1 PspC domain-containing protein [candidate division KSB1 bacterium]
MEQNKKASEPKRLYRSKIDRLVAGVCGGIAEYFEVDATLVRILWLIIIFFSGFWLGILLYLIALVVIRDNPNQNFADRKPQSAALYLGIGFILLGLLFLSNRWDWYYFRPFHFHFFRPWFFHWDRFWPIILILFGVFYLFYVLKRTDNIEIDKSRTEPSISATKLFRSRDEKIIAGVCGGLAKYLNIDPALMRILWIVVSLSTGILLGIIVYIAWMIIVPEAPITSPSATSINVPISVPKENSEQQHPRRTRRSSNKQAQSDQSE